VLNGLFKVAANISWRRKRRKKTFLAKLMTHARSFFFS
jgi:hypothetical protein